MTYYSGSYRWCGYDGYWHSGIPTSWSDCKYFQKCDDYGHWNDCPKLDGYVEGTSGNDVIDYNYTGDPEGDRIDHGDAILPGEAPEDDIVLAGSGNDMVKSGKGNDDVYAGSGNDTVYGGTGNDRIWGGKGDDRLFGEDGNDTIWGESGEDTIHGGNGNDLIFGDSQYELTDFFPDRSQDISNVVFYFDRDCDGKIDFSVKVDNFPDNCDRGFISNDLDKYYGQLRDYIIGKTTALNPDSTVIGVSIKGGTIPTKFYAVNADQNGSLPDSGPTMNTGPGNNLVLDYDDFYKCYDPSQVPGAGYDDDLYGDDGNDTIYGQGGNDTITGGKGADKLYGGADRDLFKGATVGDKLVGGETGDDWDTLDLRGSGPLKIVYSSTDPTNLAGTIHFFDDKGNETGTADFKEMEEVIPCFTPGSLIATPKGERRAEDLQPGDRVITRDNGIQEIRWVGRKSLDWKALGTNPHLKPVLIRRGSLGHGLPERDMMVSPNHRVLVANDQTQLHFEEREVLVAAKHLVNNAGVSTAESLGVTYLHFMFDRHEVVLSDGAWTESFQPGDYTLKGIGNSQRAEILELFPELKEHTGIEGYASARRTLKKHEAQLLFR